MIDQYKLVPVEPTPEMLKSAVQRELVDASHYGRLRDTYMCMLAAAPQPSAEPVAWRRRERGGEWQYFGWQETGMTHELVARCNKDGFECEAIPAPQPAKREPLTDEQIDLMAHNDDEGDWNHWTYRDCWYEGYKAGARAIERAHGIGGQP